MILRASPKTDPRDGTFRGVRTLADLIVETLLNGAPEDRIGVGAAPATFCRLRSSPVPGAATTFLRPFQQHVPSNRGETYRTANPPIGAGPTISDFLVAPVQMKTPLGKVFISVNRPGFEYVLNSFSTPNL